MKLSAPQQPNSNEHRKQLVTNRWRADTIAGVAIVLLGTGFIIGNNVDWTAPDWFGVVLAPLVFMALIIGLAYRGRLARYNLKPLTKQESAVAIQAKVAAYNFLSLAIILTIVFVDSVQRISRVGVLVVIIGLTKIVEQYRLVNPVSESAT